MTVDRDARDRQAAEARLAERGMWLERDRDRWLVLRRDDSEIEIVANGVTWRQAASMALGEPLF